jgi:hypothetical protein
VKQCPQGPIFEEKAQGFRRALFRKFDFLTGPERAAPAYTRARHTPGRTAAAVTSP